MRHKTADLDGPVHYLDFGGTGKPLVMVHGLGGSALNWMAVAPQVAESYHVVALDLAGFGQTPLFNRSAAVGANADLVHTFLEKVVGQPAVVMGNSMGGHIALLEAANHPSSVSALILVDPAIPGIHVRRPEPRRLGVMAALTIPGFAEIMLDRRVRLLGPEGLVLETLAIVCADASRVGRDVVRAHVVHAQAVLVEVGRQCSPESYIGWPLPIATRRRAGTVEKGDSCGRRTVAVERGKRGPSSRHRQRAPGR